MNNIVIEYVLRAYRIIKKEITNTSIFEIDERYFQLRRNLQICEEYLRDYDEQLAKYI